MSKREGSGRAFSVCLVVLDKMSSYQDDTLAAASAWALVVKSDEDEDGGGAKPEPGNGHAGRTNKLEHM